MSTNFEDLAPIVNLTSLLSNYSSITTPIDSKTESENLKNRPGDLYTSEDPKIAKEQLDKRSKSERAIAILKGKIARLTTIEIETLQTKAKNNDIYAQYELGMFYFSTAQKIQILDEESETHILIGDIRLSELTHRFNLAQAEKWLDLAARNQLPEAQTLLAQIFLTSGDPHKIERSFKLEESAAALGNDQSQFNMAQSYRTGVFRFDDTPIIVANPEKAYFNYLKSAKQGLINSQLNLANCYVHGMGTKKDNAKALFWLTTALGSKTAQSRLNTIISSIKTNSKATESTASSASSATAASSPKVTSTVPAIFFKSAYNASTRTSAEVEIISTASESASTSASESTSTSTSMFNSIVNNSHSTSSASSASTTFTTINSTTNNTSKSFINF